MDISRRIHYAESFFSVLDNVTSSFVYVPCNARLSQEKRNGTVTPPNPSYPSYPFLSLAIRLSLYRSLFPFLRRFEIALDISDFGGRC